MGGSLERHGTDSTAFRRIELHQPRRGELASTTHGDNDPGHEIIDARSRRHADAAVLGAIANPVSLVAQRNGYAFDQDFDILSVGGVDGHACGYWGCGGVSKVVVDLGGGNFEYQLNSNNVGGTEPHGTLQFKGAFDTVTWRSSTNEFWNGFTVGVQGTASKAVTRCPSLDPWRFGWNGGIEFTRKRRKAR